MLKIYNLDKKQIKILRKMLKDFSKIASDGDIFIYLDTPLIRFEGKKGL